MKLAELLHQQRKADEAQRVGISRNINFARAENSALRRAQYIRWAVKEHEIVVPLHLSELLFENDIRRTLGISGVLTLEIDKIESRRDQIETRQDLGAFSVFRDILDNEVLHTRAAR